MLRNRIHAAARPALALAFLLACSSPRPGPHPDDLHPQGLDPWLEGFTKVGDELLHELCKRHRAFTGVGDLPGGLVASGAGAVSRDGRRVVGKSSSTGSPEEGAGEGFTWTRPGSGLLFWPTSSGAGIQPLGFYVPPGGEPGLESEATAVSADGTVVVGASKTADTVWHAVKWTQAGVELIPDPAIPWSGRSEAFGVSGDGSVVAGMGTVASGEERGFRWTAAGGTEVLTHTAAGSVFGFGFANGVSDDGSTIVGRVSLDASSWPQACAWKIPALGAAPALQLISDGYSEAYAVSANGEIAVGYAQSNANFDIEACWWKWDSVSGVWGPAQPLGKLAGLSGSLALDLDADGRAVGGYCYSYGDFNDPTDDIETATVWFLDGALHTPGPHDASLLLSSAGIATHSGWNLDVVAGVTIDPTHRVLVLAGGGVEPGGNPEGWVAHLPPWCLELRPLLIEPNLPYLWPLPLRTLWGGPIDPLRGGPPLRP